MACHIGSLNPGRRRDGKPLLLPANLTATALVKGLLSVSQEVGICEEPKVCQRRNAVSIKRRVRLLSMLFEEIRDNTEILLPPSAVLCFTKLHGIITVVKLLLDDCRECSSFRLLIEHKTYSERFHQVSQDLAVALEGLPLELLNVSDEVMEQVKLVHMQSRNAKLNMDPKEAELRLNIFLAMREFAKRSTPHPEKLKKIFEALNLNDARDCQKELCLLEQEMETQTNYHLVSRITTLISFVRYCKCILYGFSFDEDVFNRPRTYSASDWNDIDSIPEDFICPISLDIMRDPVTVITGQTYDRASITRWIGEGHYTCPKTGQKLIDASLIPNYTLRSLIRQWCKEHNVVIETAENRKRSATFDFIPATRAALEATKMTVAFLVGNISTGSLEVQRQIAYELRTLANFGRDNRMCIGEAGAIPYLVTLLCAGDPRTQVHAMTALLDLSICKGNKVLIMEAGALDPIIKVLTSGIIMEARENAAATLFSLSVKDEYKVIIGSKPEAILGLLQLLGDGTSISGRRDAATALFKIWAYKPNRSKVVKVGAIPHLLKFLASDKPCLVDDALELLALVTSSAECVDAISQAAIIPTLLNLLNVGSTRGKENSTAVLLAMCTHGGDTTIDSVMTGGSTLPSLRALLRTGSSRARRLAAPLLTLITHSYHPR